ncbi:MAG: HD domain-containing protein [Clostridium sp.]|nr:HD domain-containing protein [Clostridium sp.]
MLSDIEVVKNIKITNNIEEDIKRTFLLNNKEKIYKHVINVAEENIRIGKRFGLDEEVCKIAALGHDIAGIIEPRDMLLYVKKHNMYLDKAEEKYPFLLHQRFSASIINEVFGISDERIIIILLHKWLNEALNHLQQYIK